MSKSHTNLLIKTHVEKKNVKNVRKVMSVDRKTYTNNNKKDMRNYKITFVEQI